MSKKLIAIIGPTACGKTARAVTLAKSLDGEIISGDSRQLYRGMDIGTGKDLQEYEGIPYHLIDICNPGEKYNLFRYIKDFNKSFNSILEKDKWPILCGGTGMYIENAISGINLPEVETNIALRQELENKSLEELTEILKQYKILHNSTDIDNKKRVLRAIEIEEYYKNNPSEKEKADRKKSRPIESLIIGIAIPRDERRKRISLRLEKRLDEGMVDEIINLINSGVSADDLIYYGLEYKFVTLFVTGQISYEEMKSQLETAIFQFAKRQMTWFRGMEKRGFQINWLPYDLEDHEFVSEVKKLLF